MAADRKSRVDVYTEDTSTGTFAYLCTHSLLSKECALKLTGLTEGKNYYVVLVATDESGTELATYNHQTFSTREDSSEYHDERVTHTSTVPVEQQVRQS